MDLRRLLQPVTDVWSWQIRAACRDVDSDVFFHPERERGATRARRDLRAKLVCRECPVIEDCRRHALSVQEPYGVWGGLSEEERRQLLRHPDRAPLAGRTRPVPA